MKRVLKIVTKLVGLLLLLLTITSIIFYFASNQTKNPSWGLTFSQTHARYLGFDARAMFDEVMTQLHPKKVRLVAYWEIVEPKPGQFDFAELDALVDRAARGGAEVLLVVGHKQPRWPECHHPAWYNELDEAQKRAALDSMLMATVNHYKSSSIITSWQVENEALFGFGDMCPSISKTELRSEIDLVRSLDPSRPILVSDSGEFGRWLPTASVGADQFGSTMYRVVYHHFWGYFKYPLPPAFFKIKSGMLRIFTDYEKVSGVELQAEPWFSTDIERTSLMRQYELMNASIFEDNVEYAKKSGFVEHYLWGVEWWYWLKVKQDDESMWSAAKYLFETNF